MTLVKLFSFIFCILFLPSFSSAAQATGGDLIPFFGTYIGQADMIEGDDPRKRDLEVIISPYRRGKGFTIEWITVSYHKERKEPGVKRRSTRMSFTPTERDGLYKPEQNNDVFSVGNDKENGKDQIVWARLLGNTLSLYALRVNDKGDYSLHIYHRQLTDKGLLMQFESLENGLPTKHVEGELIRVKEEEED